MRIIKKLCALVLICTMSLLLMGNGNMVYAAETVCNENLTVSAESQDEVLAELQYSYNEAGQTASVTGVVDKTATKAVIPASIEIDSVVYSVTAIGESAFANCESLVAVDIPDSVKSIGASAFYNCTGLTEISVPASVTSMGQYAFNGCSGIKKISVPFTEDHMSNYPIFGCVGLEELHFIAGGEYYYDMGQFSASTGLKSIYIHKDVEGYSLWNINKLTSDYVIYTYRERMNSAIKETDRYEYIRDLAGDEKQSGRYVYSALTGGVEIDEYLYSSTETSIEIPEYIDGKKVIRICSDAFSYCYNLEEIVIPGSVYAIGWGDISYCQNLEEIVLEEGMNWADINFVGCDSIQKIYLPKSIKTLYGYKENAVYYVYNDSYALDYVKENNLSYEIVDNTEELPQITLTTSGVLKLSQDRTNVFAGMVVETSAEAILEYRWKAHNKTLGTTAVVQDWTENNEWLSWNPISFGEYELIAEARLKSNPNTCVSTTSEAFEYNPHIKGKCQMPYWGEGGGYLIGVESYENPNQSYQYEMLILDCTLLAEGKPAWVYTTNKFTVTEGAAGWCVWQPQYGYYWTLFRVYDAQGNMIDQACYPFVNAY